MRNLENRIYKDQLITVEDLEEFKTDLLESIKLMIQGIPAQSKTEWLKSEQVRNLLKISAGKLLTLRCNGTLPYTKIGGVIYYDSQDIQNMFAKRKTKL